MFNLVLERFFVVYIFFYLFAIFLKNKENVNLQHEGPLLKKSSSQIQTALFTSHVVRDCVQAPSGRQGASKTPLFSVLHKQRLYNKNN